MTLKLTAYFQEYTTMPRGEKNRGKLKHNLTGQTFGRLRVVGFFGRKNGHPHWRCYCDPEFGGCSGYSIVSTYNLIRPTPPHARSCGCYRKELMRQRQTAALAALRLQLAEASQSTTAP